MAQLFTSFIPGEFLDAWIRGQYVIGPRTLDYQYAGLALILRGFYRYDVWVESKISDADPPKAREKTQTSGERTTGEDSEIFGGYAAVYVKNNELSLAGFRVYACSKTEKTPLFWKSVFSRFIDNQHSKTELYFPYNIYKTRDASSDPEKCDSIKKLALSCKGRDDLDEIERTIMGGHESSSLLVYNVLSELFYSAGESIADSELRGLCMLTPLEADVHLRDNEASTSDLALRGQNYGVDVPISGTVEFRRLSAGFLKNVTRGERTSP